MEQNSFQPVYVLFPGNGVSMYFTAPTKEQASEFISSQTDLITKYCSAWETTVYCKAVNFTGFLSKDASIPVLCIEEFKVPIINQPGFTQEEIDLLMSV